MGSCKFLKGSQLFLTIILKSAFLVNTCYQIMHLVYTLSTLKMFRAEFPLIQRYISPLKRDRENKK